MLSSNGVGNPPAKKLQLTSDASVQRESSSTSGDIVSAVSRMDKRLSRANFGIGCTVILLVIVIFQIWRMNEARLSGLISE
jgi:hypothetical protein